MSAWDNLSIRDKAEMMRVAIGNGITNINDIKREYNEFAEGGPKKSWTMEDEANYRQWRNSLPDNLKYTDDNIYDMVGAYQAGMQPTLEDDGLYHLGSRNPQTGKILKAPYHPTYLQALSTDARMGYYPTITKEGTYTSTWKGNNSILPEEEIEVPYRAYDNGGSIHIKPSHRGRLTELKARTGKTESELYNDGNPAHKKMVVFARNARKWHGLGGTLFPDGGSMNPSVGKAMQYFMDKGFTDYQAAGLIGNLMRESSMNPGAVNKDSQAYGLAQWLGDRKRNLHGRYGSNPTFDQQLEYIWDELNSTHKRGLRALKASKSADEAARNAMGYYEFSAGPEGAIAAMNSHGQNGEDAMRKGILFANDIMGTIAGPARYNPQDSLPPNFQVPENWELLYKPQYPLDELQATGTFMPAEEVPLDSLMPTPQSRRAKALDVLRQYEYLSSLLSQ